MSASKSGSLELKTGQTLVDNTTDMTTANMFLNDWAAHPFGKALRVLIAAGGLITGTMIVLLSTIGVDSVWLVVLIGLTLGANAVRAALQPNLLRLSLVLATLLAVPVVGLVM
jgi:hypothetical protein